MVVAVGAGVPWRGPRGSRLPGDTARGDIADNVTSELAEARSLQASDLKGAIQRYDDVLKVEPDNAEALTYRGWLVALVGAQGDATDLVAEGRSSRCSGPCRSRPPTPTPYCFKAIIRFRMFERCRRRPQRPVRPVPRAQPARRRCVGLVRA